MNKKTRIIKKALERLEKTLGYKLVTFRLDEKGLGGLQFDGTLTFKTKTKDKKYTIECKKTFNRQMLGRLMNTFNKTPHKGILIAEYVNQNLAEELKKLEIPFVDTVGNAYLNNPPLYVYTTGNKPEKKPDKAIGKAFNPTGLKVLFALLCQPTLINQPYREIARMAGVALGTVGKTLEDLRKRNFIVEYKKERKITGLKKLFDEWLMLYPAILKPHLLIGKYRTPEEKDWWTNEHLNLRCYLWSGEVAAYNMIEYMRPVDFAIYTREAAGPFIAANRLTKDLNGNVEILEAFWDEDLYPDDKKNAPPILVYADLLTKFDYRAIETAKEFYDKKLKKIFG